MKPSTCLFNSAAALQRVFLRNASISEGSTCLKRSVLAPTFSSETESLSVPPPRRYASTAAPRNNKDYFVRSLNQTNYRSRPATPIKFGEGYRVRDSEIRYSMIQLKLPAEEGGGVSEPQYTQHVLRRVNLETHSLVIRAMPSPEEGRDYAVCEVVDRKAEFKSMVEMKKKKQQEKAKQVSKELEINWAVAPHDLKTKLNQLEKFLNKGYKVELRLMGQQKKSKKKASVAEMQNVMASVEEAIVKLGSKEYKPREGAVGQTGTVMLYLQGKKVEPPKESVSEAPVEGTQETAA